MKANRRFGHRVGSKAVLGISYGLSLALWLGGCGGSGSAGSGVDRNKKLGDLNDAEKKKLCDSFARQVDEKLPQATRCRAQAAGAGFAALLSLGDAEEACTTAEAACLKEPADIISCDEQALEEFPTCDATVGTIEDCSIGYVSDVSAYAAQFPACKDLTDFIAQASEDELAALSQRPEPPAACEKMPDDCNFPPELE
jgi:hypothetical protein